MIWLGHALLAGTGFPDARAAIVVFVVLCAAVPSGKRCVVFAE